MTVAPRDENGRTFVDVELHGVSVVFHGNRRYDAWGSPAGWDYSLESINGLSASAKYPHWQVQSITEETVTQQIASSFASASAAHKDERQQRLHAEGFFCMSYEHPEGVTLVIAAEAAGEDTYSLPGQATKVSFTLRTGQPSDQEVFGFQVSVEDAAALFAALVGRNNNFTTTARCWIGLDTRAAIEAAEEIAREGEAA